MWLSTLPRRFGIILEKILDRHERSGIAVQWNGGGGGGGSQTEILLFEPVHEISNNVVCATSKASDQPAHTRSLIRAFASRLSILCMIVKLLTEHYLEFISLKASCRGSSESTAVKMLNCWKSHALAILPLSVILAFRLIN